MEGRGRAGGEVCDMRHTLHQLESSPLCGAGLVVGLLEARCVDEKGFVGEGEAAHSVRGISAGLLQGFLRGGQMRTAQCGVLRGEGMGGVP